MTERTSNLIDIFIGKLKEQTFTIVLLVCVLGYQHVMYTKRINEYKIIIAEKEKLILTLTSQERERILQKNEQIARARDEYIQQLINKKDANK